MADQMTITVSALSDALVKAGVDPQTAHAAAMAVSVIEDMARPRSGQDDARAKAFDLLWRLFAVVRDTPEVQAQQQQQPDQRLEIPTKCPACGGPVTITATNPLFAYCPACRKGVGPQVVRKVDPQ